MKYLINRETSEAVAQASGQHERVKAGRIAKGCTSAPFDRYAFFQSGS